VFEEVIYDNLRLQVGKKIRSTRLEKGLTMRAVADAVGMEENNYSRFEKGRTNPTLKSLFKICQVLEINMKDLFTD
jgi:transcriptional regulator with XRE-family HTH domain